MHGDSSIVDTICALGQWWNTPIPMVRKQGNYGSVTGDPHAAARYIEVGMNEFAYDIFFSEWSSNITEFLPSYTGEDVEPECLPTAIPLVLCKNVFGLGYGASTGIPYFPFNDVIDLTIKLIKNPKAKAVLIPDSPTGCPIVEADWEEICTSGYGSFRYRGEAEIDHENNAIIIKSTPHTTSITAIMSKLKSLVEDKKLDGIEDMIDQSTKAKGNKKASQDLGRDNTEIKLVIYVKKGFSPEQLLDTIYKTTELQTPFAVKFDVVYDYENFHVSLKSIILNWIQFRRETKRRYVSKKYSEVRKKIHVLEAIMKILKSKGEEKLIKMARKCKNRADMVAKLIKEFGLTDIQAEALTDMRIYKVSRENIDSYKKDLSDAVAREKEIKSILENDEDVDMIIINELKALKAKYGIDRLAPVISMEDIDEIPTSKHIIVLTNKGYLKKLDINYSGVGELEDGDYITHLFKTSNPDDIMIFDNMGNVYNLPVFNIDNTGKGKGVAIDSLIKLPKGAKVVTMFTKPTIEELESSEKLMYMLFATKNGIVKKSLAKYYINCGCSGIIGCNLSDDDELVSVSLIKGDKPIIMYTEQGKYIKYNTDEISETKRISKGVIGIKLAKEDSVLGIEVINKTKNYVVVLTNKGNGKKCLLRTFDTSKRGTGGTSLIKLGNNELIRIVISAKNSNELELYTYEGLEQLNVDDIPEMLKITAGKKLIKLGRKNDILKATIK